MWEMAPSEVVFETLSHLFTKELHGGNRCELPDENDVLIEFSCTASGMMHQPRIDWLTYFSLQISVLYNSNF